MTTTFSTYPTVDGPTWTTYLLDPDADGDLPEVDADLFGGAA